MESRRGRAVAGPGAEKCGEPVKVPRGIAHSVGRSDSFACGHQVYPRVGVAVLHPTQTLVTDLTFHVRAVPCGARYAQPRDAGAGASKASRSASLKRQRALGERNDAAAPSGANDECKDSVDDKKRERKRRNRESAALSRMRAKQRVAQLEEATVTLREQNSELRQRVDSLSYMQQGLQATVAQLHMTALQYHPQQTVDRALRQATMGDDEAAGVDTAAAATGIADRTASRLLQAGPGLQVPQLHNDFTTGRGEAASALYAGRPLQTAPTRMPPRGAGGVATIGGGDGGTSDSFSLLAGGVTAAEPQDQVGEGDAMGFGLHGSYDVGRTGGELRGGIAALDPDIASMLDWDEFELGGKK